MHAKVVECGQQFPKASVRVIEHAKKEGRFAGSACAAGIFLSSPLKHETGSEIQRDGLWRMGSNETVRNPEFPEEDGDRRARRILRESSKRWEFEEVTASFENVGRSFRASDP